MPLIVENGKGLSNAESYISVATADAYHLSHGNNKWESTAVHVKEVALRRATQYLDSHYSWKGYQLTLTQALRWPRYLGTWSNAPIVPSPTYTLWLWPVKRIQDACAELAIRSITENLYSDQADAQVKREKIGPIEVEYEIAGGGGQVRFAIVDDLVNPFTGGGGRLSMSIERAS